MAKKEKTLQAIGGEHGFKVEVAALIKEVTDNGLRQSSGVLKVPMQLLLRYLNSVATRASQLNDPILNKLMCDMAMYEVARPGSPEFDPKVIETIYEMAAEQRKKEAKENSSNS